MATVAPSGFASTNEYEIAVLEPSLGDVFYEVVDNRIRELPPMSAREIHLASTLMRILSSFAWTGGLCHVEAEMLFLLRAATNLQRRPDLAYVSFERWPRGKRVPGTPAWEVVPNLAIEVVSRRNAANEIIEKIDDYFASGVERVWVIYPTVQKLYDYASSTSVRIMTGEDAIDGGTLLPGFSLALSGLFGEGAGGEETRDE